MPWLHIRHSLSVFSPKNYTRHYTSNITCTTFFLWPMSLTFRLLQDIISFNYCTRLRSVHQIVHAYQAFFVSILTQKLHPSLHILYHVFNLFSLTYVIDLQTSSRMSTTLAVLGQYPRLLITEIILLFPF